MTWTSTQSYDPLKEKSKPKAFDGFAIWKEWIEERFRLIKKLSVPLSFFEKRRLRREGFQSLMKKRVIKTKETIKGQNFVSYKEV